VRLICHRGALQGLAFEIPQGRSTVGREPGCDLTLEDPKVSRVHAFLVRENKALICLDNRSTNGTYINGERLTPEQPYRLSIDDNLLVGGCEYRVAEALISPTVHFSPNQPHVTRVFQTDAVALRLSDALDFYQRIPPAAEKEAPGESTRIRKLMRSLESLFQMTRRLAQVMPLDDLFVEMRDMLFDVFDGVENVVFLIQENGNGEYVPRLIANVNGDHMAPVIIPHSVFHRALTERVTIVANDAPSDERFLSSESIVGLSIRSLMCVPLILGDRILGVLYVDNRTRGSLFDESDAELLSAFATHAAVAIDNARLCDTLQKSYHQTLQALVNTLEAKDKYTVGHSERVAEYAIGIGRELQLAEPKLEMLRLAAELHDIGKIGINEIIINKTGKLSETEYNEIKGHTIKGESIIRPITYLQPILPVVRSHHEWWDGSGYPDRLRGEEIPLLARILSVADALDAMTTKRAYNRPVDFRDACEEIQEASGTQFDPMVVEAFTRYMEKMIAAHSGAA